MAYLTERQLFNWRMGRVMTDEEIIAITPKRDRSAMIARINDSDMLYVLCDICNSPFCVNNTFEDRKPRTPKYKDFIVCIRCDPRHIDDRYMKEGYRIMHKPRLRIIQHCQVTRQLAKTGQCMNPAKLKCNCAACVAKKLWPPF